jgi:RimJ/RimL family protein N-acetyltransferase
MNLTGRAVRLRAPEERDVPMIVTLLSDPQVAGGLGSWAWHPYGEQDAKRFLAEADPRSANWAIEDLGDGAFVGLTGLSRIDYQDHNAAWGIWLGPPDRWDRGLGSEACSLTVRFAFEHLGLEKVWVQVPETNPRARRAVEKAGFELEGTLARHVFVDGRLVAAHVLSAFRDHPLYTLPATSEVGSWI